MKTKIKTYTLKRLATILLIYIAGIPIFAQPKEKIHQNILSLIKKDVFNSENLIYASKPDSILFYGDTIEMELYYYDKMTYLPGKFIREYAYRSYDGWDLPQRNEYYYDNNLIKMPYEIYLNGHGALYEDYWYFYQPSIGDTLTTISNWDTTKNDWRPFSKIEHQINEQGINQLSEYYLWDTTTDAWVFNSEVHQQLISLLPDTLIRTISFPDTVPGEVEAKFIFHKNEDNQIFKVDKYETKYSFDSIIYDSAGNVSVKYLKHRSTYFNQIQKFYYDEFNRLIKYDNYIKSTQDSEWKFGGRNIFYYSQLPESNISTISQEEIRIIPNPALDFIQIENYDGDVRIINLNGQTIIERNYKQFDFINIENLNKGLYIISLKNKKNINFIKY